MVPVVFAYARVARNEDAYFLPAGQQARRANYLVEQLISQRSATELATLGSGRKLAASADEHRGAATALRDSILVALARSSAVGSLVTAALLGAALVAIVAGGGGSAGLAGGVLGVIAGVAATRAGGFAFGRHRFDAEGAGVPTPPGRPHRDPPAAERHSGRIGRADSCSVTYPDAARPALDRVTLHVRAGSIVALVGVNGAGKTTAVNALLGVVDLSGSVHIDGVDAATLPLQRRLAMFGLLTQEFGRYDLTIRDTVALGTPGPVSDHQVGRRSPPLTRPTWSAISERSRYPARPPASAGSGCPAASGDARAGPHLPARRPGLAPRRTHLRHRCRSRAAGLPRAPAAPGRTHNLGRLPPRLDPQGDGPHFVFDHGQIVEHGQYDQLINARGRFAAIFAEQA